MGFFRFHVSPPLHALNSETLIVNNNYKVEFPHLGIFIKATTLETFNFHIVKKIRKSDIGNSSLVSP